MPACSFVFYKTFCVPLQPKKNLMQPFYKSFLIFCVIVLWVLLTLKFFTNIPIFNFTWVLFAYFVALTLLSYKVLNSGVNKEAMDFYNASMASTTIRLFISAGVLFFYYLNFGYENVNFTIVFFALYFAFTAFEIKEILQKVNQK